MYVDIGYGAITISSYTNVPTTIVIICCQYVDLGYYIDVILGNIVICTIVEWDNPWVILNCFYIEHSCLHLGLNLMVALFHLHKLFELEFVFMSTSHVVYTGRVK
jgi:hypothetical protein